MAKDESTKKDFKSNGKGKRRSKAGAERSTGRGYARTNHSPNSADWYYTDTVYRDAVANLPLNIRTGSPVNVVGLDGTGHLNWESVPGIMSIRLHEAVGPAEVMTDPINQAAFKIWTFIRSTMSGATLVADAADIMMYVLAVRSMYGWLSSLKKVYGLLSAFDINNHYLPRAIIESEHFDYDDLLANKSDFEAFVNASIDKANNFVLPNTMPIFNRTVFLSESIYMDATSFKSQIYDFVWDNHYKYFWNGGPNGSGSYLDDLWPAGERDSATRWTYADIRTYTNDLINALFTNEDIGTISGYMMRAYGDARITLGKVAPDYTVPFVYSEEILSQIQNLRCYGRVVTPRITQDPTVDNGTIHSYYHLAGQSALNDVIKTWATAINGGTFAWNASVSNTLAEHLESSNLLVYHKDVVSPDDWLTSTRLTASIYNPTPMNFILYVGSEYVVDVQVWHYRYFRTGSRMEVTFEKVGNLPIFGSLPHGFSSQDIMYWDTTDQDASYITLINYRNFDAFINAYRFSPYRRTTFIENKNGVMSFADAPISSIDLDVNAVITSDDLKKLHECALLGEFKQTK